MNDVRREASVGELLSALARDTGVLVRQEVQLAATEMTSKARSFSRNALLIGFGGALAHAGFLALLIAVVLALDTILPLWMSSLIIGVLVLGAGYALVQKGLRAIRHLDPVPKEALRTLRDDVVWAKEQLP